MDLIQEHFWALINGVLLETTFLRKYLSKWSTVDGLTYVKVNFAASIIYNFLSFKRTTKMCLNTYKKKNLTHYKIISKINNQTFQNLFNVILQLLLTETRISKNMKYMSK